MCDLYFSYEMVDWTFISHLLNQNSAILSRTRKGVSDTSSSHLKLPLRLSGIELENMAASNEHSVHQYIFGMRQYLPKSSKDIYDILISIADITNSGLLPKGRWREWQLGGEIPRVSPENIQAAVTDFCATIYARQEELFIDPVPILSWIEWELNGGALHPFYDGCGRISRSFSAYFYMRSSVLLPYLDSRDQYYRNVNDGMYTFSEYIKCRIIACREYIRQMPL